MRFEKTVDYGADDFLVKQVKPEELIATIRERLVTKQSDFFVLFAITN